MQEARITGNKLIHRKRETTKYQLDILDLTES